VGADLFQDHFGLMNNDCQHRSNSLKPLGELGLVVVDPAPRLFLKRQFLSGTRAFFHVGSGSSQKIGRHLIGVR